MRTALAFFAVVLPAVFARAEAAGCFTADWSRVKPYVSTVDRTKGTGTADFASEVRDGALVVTVRSLENATVKAPVGFSARVIPYAGRYMTVRTSVSGDGIDSCEALIQGYIDRSAEGKDRKHYWKPSTLPVLRTPSEWTKTRHLDPKLDELSFSFVMSKPGVYRFHRLELFEAPDPLAAYEVGRNFIANGGAEQGHYATSAIGESSFRFGTCGGVIEPFKGKIYSGMLKPSLGTAVVHSGMRAFELKPDAGEFGQFYFNPVPTVDDRAFVFSFWAKASGRGRFKAGLFVSSGNAYEKTFSVSSDWTCYSLRIPNWGQKGEDGLSFYGKVTGAGVAVPFVEPSAGMTLWIDDAFSTVGTLDGAFVEPKASVSAVRSSHPRGVYRPGEPVRGRVDVQGLQRPARLERRLYDWRNREILAGRETSRVSKNGELQYAILPSKGLRGPMTAEWTLRDGTTVLSRVTSSFGVQPACPRLEPRLSVNVMFGSPEQSLAFMREFGIGGARLWGGGRNWDLDYGYRYSRLFHEAGIRTLFVLDDPNLVQDGKTLRGEALLPVDVTDWFTRQLKLVDAHRGEIDVYEFLNEYNIWKGRLANPDPTRFAEPTMAKYLDCIKAFRPLLKAHDPHALLAGCATCSTDLKFIGEFLAQGGGASVDMITEHAYTGNPDCPDYAKKLDEGLARAKAAGVAKWAQTEAGATSPNHLTDGLIDDRALEQTHNDLRNMLIAWAKGLDHYSHFMLSTGRTGTDWNLTYLGNGDNGFEDLPKPALFAFRTAADVIGSARGEGMVELGSGCRAALFSRAGGSVAAIWKWQGEAVRGGLKQPLKQTQFYDAMGNRLLPGACELSVYPIYVVSRLPVDDLRRALVRNRVESGPMTSVGADASDPNLESVSTPH